MPTLAIVIIAAAGILTALEIYAGIKDRMDQKIWNELKEKYNG